MSFGVSESGDMEKFDAEVMAALEELKGRPKITVEIPALTAFFLLSQLQLAFRHPRNVGPSKVEVTRFFGHLRPLLCQPGDVLDTVLTMGFEERFDR